MHTPFIYHQDPGHGWVEVPRQLLKELNIEGAISKYSYIKEDTVYLEEDCDMQVFFTAYKAKYGEYPKSVEKYHDFDCFIRNLRSF